MFTVEDFLSQYEAYSDEQLIGIHSDIENYNPEAGKAVNMLIDKRGGLEATLQRVRQNQTIEAEKARIRFEAKTLAAKGIDPAFIKGTAMPSTILTSEQVTDVLDTALTEHQIEADDKKIKPRTIYGSLLGGILASLIGGSLWGGQLLLAGGYIDLKITLLLLTGLFLVCYGIIKLATKQSKKNMAVLIATITSVLVSIFIGHILFSAFR